MAVRFGGPDAFAEDVAHDDKALDVQAFSAEAFADVGHVETGVKLLNFGLEGRLLFALELDLTLKILVLNFTNQGILARADNRDLTLSGSGRSIRRRRRERGDVVQRGTFRRRRRGSGVGRASGIGLRDASLKPHLVRQIRRAVPPLLAEIAGEASRKADTADHLRARTVRQLRASERGQEKWRRTADTISYFPLSLRLLSHC